MNEQAEDLDQAMYRLQAVLDEHFHPGARVQVMIGLEKELTTEQLALLESELRKGGLNARVEFGATREWPNTLRLSFAKPSRRARVLFLPLAVLFIGALGVVAVGGFLGWKVGNAFGNLTDALAKNIVPLTLIIGGVFVLANAGKRP